MKYRRRADIIADILTIAAKGAKKTRIMYIANLSHALLEKYLEQTISMGFVQEVDESYEVTDKGRRFLERYNQFSSRYRELDGQLEKLRFEREFLERMCEPRNASSKPARTRKPTQ